MANLCFIMLVRRNGEPKDSDLKLPPMPQKRSTVLLNTSRSHNEPVRQLQSYWQPVKKLVLVGLASSRSQFLLDVSVHIIPFITISQAGLKKECCLTYAFISSTVSFFFSSSTLYVAIFLLAEKPANLSSARTSY